MEKGVIMKKGKSTYQFPINVDPNVAHQTIMNWLGANSFELKQKDGQYYYQYSDPIVGGWGSGGEGGWVSGCLNFIYSRGW